MDDDSSVALVERWRAGDQRAAGELVERYASQLADLAQRRLPQVLAGRVGADEIVQSVFCCFFLKARAGQFTVGGRGDLWRLLVAITVNKVRSHRQFNAAARRDAGRELLSLDADDRLGVPIEALAPGPTAEEAASLVETVARLLDGLEAWQRRAVELRLQGHSLREIAAATGQLLPTVRRLIDRVKVRLAADVAAD